MTDDTENYTKSLVPYLVSPYGHDSTLMGPHPLSPLRQAQAGAPKATLKSMLNNRVSESLWFPSTQSLTFDPMTDCKSFYTSYERMQMDRRKHYRRGDGPRERFAQPHTTHHELGWHIQRHHLVPPLHSRSSTMVTRLPWV
eukprot:GEMP01018292.1.p1 GENE.GEMP01018292.1~~GEMP01018292.1.p1  ORF type:complete len:141 (+),score=23.10 GEMP01018292.1:185-607(+)